MAIGPGWSISQRPSIFCLHMRVHSRKINGCGKIDMYTSNSLPYLQVRKCFLMRVRYLETCQCCSKPAS